MHAIYLSVLFGSLPSLASASLSRRVVNDPAAIYLQEMCLPSLSNWTRRDEYSANGLVRSLANSPFPCEQAFYIQGVCTANGTSENDFLAEQQCLCNGSFFQARELCDACYYAHGYQNPSPEEAASSRSSLKTAECSPSPPFQPYSNLLPDLLERASSARLAPSLTLLPDKNFNNTAISVYATGTLSATPGAITGSATARVTSWTNYNGVRYTPTSIPPNNGTATGRSGSDSATPSPTSGASTGAGSSGASSAGANAPSSTTQSANLAAAGETKFAGGLVAAAIVGVAALL